MIGGLFRLSPRTRPARWCRRPLELGIRYVDTAPLYGLGASERRVGEALAGRPGASCTLSTKVGRLVGSTRTEHEPLPEGMWHVPDDVKPVFDFSRDGIRRSLFESLERLGLDRVDVAYVHDPDDHLDQAIGEALPGARRAARRGPRRSDRSRDDERGGARAHRARGPARLRPRSPARYTLLDQSALDELLPLCEREGVAVVAGGVFNSGILADPVARRPLRLRGGVASPCSSGRGAPPSVCAAHGVPLPAAALQFAARSPGRRRRC